MSSRNRFSYRRRIPKRVGTRLESGRRVDTPHPRSRQFLRVGLLLTLFIATVLAFPRQQSYDLGVQVGNVWNRNDLVAPFRFAIYKPADVLERERREAVEGTPSVVRIDPEAEWRTTVAADSLRMLFGDIFAHYRAWQFERQRGSRSTEALADSVAYSRLRDAFPVRLGERQWRYLLGSHIARTPGLGATTRAGAGEPSLDERLLADVLVVSRRLMDRQTLNVPADSLPSSQIVLWDDEERTQRLIDRSVILGLDEARDEALRLLAQRHGARPDTVALGLTLFDYVFHPNLSYQYEETLRRIDRSVSSVSETRGFVQEGEVIVREGEVVSPEVLLKFSSLNRALADMSGNFRVWRILLGQALLTLACYVMLFFFLHLFRPEIWNSTRDLSLILVLYLLFVGMFALVVRLPFDHAPGLLVPVAMVPILLTVIYDSRLAIVAVVCLALIGGFILGFDFEFLALTIFSGTLATFSVRGIRTRAQFMVATGIVLLTYVITVSVFQLFQLFDLNVYLRELGLVLGNAVLLTVTLPALWIFERLFSVTTDVTLLELSDTNQPLLRELSLRAPGSFSHSLQVANLAEAAADTIGANALLTRVGALYHDIGKMLKPEYFVENQGSDFNPHDQLTPKMSALVIASHVKDGIDLAKTWKLPRVIQDFIPMHHGTTRIEFFYQKALDRKEGGKEDVLEADFRYPGPRPTTREAGILMLADSVEAAGKSVAGSGKPSPKRFESLIDSIFKSRMEDGQLDECPLTFADLGRIRETFVSILSGMYHFRIRYPGQDAQDGGEKAMPERLPSGGATESAADSAPPENMGPSAASELKVGSGPESRPEKKD